ncbi:General secretion pathway protein M [Deinococcus proteolyticus MRP]|uniref:General secretion pathway protein M n=1 Tax=Deinococcus proteolyticus (strain ATCC 35074 / DSM 20540 / JCM 6276 / NBRC 101906 / NCIMB 13154 / VKM Ac-1939 / CCM 2703 / MRP) TaxID=693977 RepID=F0RLE4_DEIPM|nr:MULTISPECIES: type 4a pilus biogenesis protein PilO [Deinococcus]ADY25848.1 General secretion pathway protein M [Deinococcus proteolyticus MRP]MCY1701970.1 type 4a pilus biogenesis protein PilO [Deinococcus sp. SL84]
MTKTRLDPKYIFFLALALSFLVLGLWYTFRYQARQQEIATLKTDIEAAELKVSQYRQAEARLPALREEVAGLRQERAEFVAALPQNNEMAQLLGEMRGNAQASGTQIRGVNVAGGPATADLPGGVRPIPISMTLAGTYGEVFRTLRAMETMNRFTTIDQLTLQSPEATSFNPELGGTLNMTVYTFDPSLAAPPTAPAPATGAPATDASGAAASDAATAPAAQGAAQ